MGQIRDYACSYHYVMGIDTKIESDLNLIFPDCYKERESMAKIASYKRQSNNMDICILPFCHTVEAEALGGDINFGDSVNGPRARSYIYSSMEEMENIGQIDFSKGRVREVLEACRILKKEGQDVILEISGPVTILNVLLDPKYIYKAMRKKPELMKLVYDKLEKVILDFTKEAIEVGVDIISYADSTASVGILGPKMAEDMTRIFTYAMLKKMEKIVKDKCLVHLCPKTTFALLGCDLAHFEDLEQEDDLTYGKALLSSKGRTVFLGDRCINKLGQKLRVNKIRKVVLE